MATISAQMATNLANLTTISDDMNVAQNRLSTGKKVSSVLDDPAVFFRAQTFTAQAEGLNSTNKKIDQATKNLKTATDGLDTMIKSLEGTLATLRDAKAKVVGTAGTGISTTGGLVYTGSTTAANDIVVTRALAASDADTRNDSSRFQAGDVFTVTISDGKSAPETRYFRAFRQDSAGTGGQSASASDGKARDAQGRWITSTGAVTTDISRAVNADGRSEARAMVFQTEQDLMNAIADSTGGDVTVTKTAEPRSTTQYRLNLVVSRNDLTVSFQQTTNNDSTPLGAGANAGTTFDFGNVFGVNGTARALLSGSGNPSYTYSGTPSTTSESAKETRRQAAETFRATLYNLQNIVRDAALPGFNNLLKGETMAVDLNETGEVKQSVKIGAVDVASLGFAGYTDTGGTVAIPMASNDFNGTNEATTIDLAVSTVATALSTLRTRAAGLGSQNTMMTARLEYNKNLVKTLNEIANSMVAADMAEEAAKLASLQNQMTFATNNLSVTKQAEQSLIQILR